MPRWEVLFKVTVLRLISFNMDHYWSLEYPAGSAIEVSFYFPIDIHMHQLNIADRVLQEETARPREPV